MRLGLALWILIAAAIPRSTEAGGRGPDQEKEEVAGTKPRVAARPGDDELLYAMGAILGAKIRDYALSAKELENVRRGFVDSAAGRKLSLSEADLDEWGPRVDAMLARRSNPKVNAEKERGKSFAAQAAGEPGAQTLASGAVLRILKPGQGINPKATDLVRVTYQGRLIDGTVFDSSEKHGGPAEFHLDKVIRCWTEGVQRMKVGEQARLICPAAVAYGDQGRPPQIPGGATLIFDIELFSATK